MLEEGPGAVMLNRILREVRDKYGKYRNEEKYRIGKFRKKKKYMGMKG